MTKTNQCSILHFQLILGRKIRNWENALNFFMLGTNEVFYNIERFNLGLSLCSFIPFKQYFKQNKLWTSLASKLDRQSRR